MDIKIVDYGMADVESIIFNPDNWRIHPLYQQEMLRGLIDEIGYVDPIKVNVTTGNLVDGHLRVQVVNAMGVKEIPCVYIEVTEEEEKMLIMAFNTLPDFAAHDPEVLKRLIENTKTENEGILKLMQETSVKFNLDAFNMDEIDFSMFSEVTESDFLFKVVVMDIQTRDEAMKIAEKMGSRAEVQQYRAKL